MRKLTVAAFVSVDGVMQSPGEASAVVVGGGAAGAAGVSTGAAAASASRMPAGSGAPNMSAVLGARSGAWSGGASSSQGGPSRLGPASLMTDD